MDNVPQGGGKKRWAIATTGAFMGRTNRQKGATLVEAAMVFPLIILLMMSILELGLAFREFLTLSFTARDAARVGSLAGNDPDADCDIIQSIVAAFGSADLHGVDIHIFKASEATGNPEVGKVNTWTLHPTGNPNTCLPIDWSITEAWPSTTREVTVGSSTELDILGVTLDTTHTWVTGFPPWRGTIDISRTALQRLEPEAFE
jgi:Flp pilus assembly protein TadG